MFIHQAHNSIGDEIFNAYTYRNAKWLPHLHKAYELTYVVSGRIRATIAGKEYTLKTGECILISPYQIHAYDESDGVTFIVVFAGSYVSEFSKLLNNREPSDARVFLSKQTRDYFCEVMIGDCTLDKTNIKKMQKPDLLSLKASLYAVCADFMRTATLLPRQNGNYKLLFDILSYVENNFTSDISLTGMANELGYDHRYISRIFGSSLNINFKTLVNQYRCDYAKRLLTSTTLPVADIAMNSGFQSIRTFNRVFLETTGTYPSDFRK